MIPLSGSIQEAHIVIWGVVQGVNFRRWAVERGKDFSVGGTVRNCPDGSVEIHSSGSAPNIGSFIASLWSGPRGARVNRIAVTWITPTGVNARTLSIV